ncbi:hypothetical protein ACXX82_23505 [Glaciimonas sp. GNP009]
MDTVIGAAVSETSGATRTASNPHQSKQNHNCSLQAIAECFFRVSLDATHPDGTFGFYASTPINTNNVRFNAALIVIHGHSHDAAKTFDAAIAAATTERLSTTLVIAPLFQVNDTNAKKCRSEEQQTAQANDFVWTCASWMEGGSSQNDPNLTSFKAIDKLVEKIIQRYPTIRTVTIAGFSAGAQTIQHYIGFSTLDAQSYSVRYVIADPGTWLYFDNDRPQPMIADRRVTWPECDADGQSDFAKCTVKIVSSSEMMSSCPTYNNWKYGIENLPKVLMQKHTANAVRIAYQSADITYLEAALDSDNSKKASYKVLDKSCGAALQGPFRLQRGLAYALYDQQKLRSPHHKMMKIVPDCGHDVSCVFPSESGRQALFH